MGKMPNLFTIPLKDIIEHSKLLEFKNRKGDIIKLLISNNNMESSFLLEMEKYIDSIDVMLIDDEPIRFISGGDE